VFSMTTLRTCDSRDGSEALAKHVMDDRVAVETNTVTVILFSCHCCLLSNANS
jgi:hypothetical protein